MKRYHIQLSMLAILVAMLWGGCLETPPAPVPTQTLVVPSVQPSVIPTETQTLVPPTQSPTQEPATADCASVKFVSPQAKDTVPAGDVSIRWEPSECVMVLQYYQHEKLVDEFFDAGSGMTIAIPEPGPTELKIWVSGSSTPSDAIWITVE